MAPWSATTSARDRPAACLVAGKQGRSRAAPLPPGWLSRRRLYLAQGGSYFLQVRHDGNVVILEPGHFALFVHNGVGASLIPLSPMYTPYFSLMAPLG